MKALYGCIGAFAAAVLASAAASCRMEAGGEPVSSPTYTVTATKPANGAINASPASGPAGATLTLSNTPQEHYTFSHCILNRTRLNSNTFTLNNSATASGEFTCTGPAPAEKNASPP